MGQSLGKNPVNNRKPKPPQVYCNLSGLTRADFDTIWSIFMNHDDAAIDVSSSTFEDIMTEFCRGFDAVRKESLGTSDFKLVKLDDQTDILAKYFAKFVEDHSSTNENSEGNLPSSSDPNKKMDVFHLFVGLMLLSKLSKKQRIQLLYFWFTCFEDEEDPGLEEDDFLLPLKTIMNTVMVVTLKNDLTDQEIQIIRDEICQEMVRARALSSASIAKADGVVDDAVSGAKTNKKVEAAANGGKFYFKDIWRWAESSPIVTSWIKLLGTGDSDDDSDGEESLNLHATDPNDADEHDDEIHNDIRERSAKEHRNMDPDSSEDPFANAAAGGGDEFMAVKPCTGTIQHIHKKIKQISGANGSRKNKPSESDDSVYDYHGIPVNEIGFEREDLKNPGKTATESRLELEWVHGYRGSDCRNNVYYVPRKQSSSDSPGTNLVAALYFTAAVGVKINLDNGSSNPKLEPKQSFAFHHTDDILSMAVYDGDYKRDGAADSIKLVATGEIGRMPKICIWKPESMALLNTLKGFHRRGVNQLAFSKTGQYILSLGVDDQHSLAIYDWEKGTMIHNSKSHKSKVFALGFEHLLRSPTKKKHVENFYSCGDKHLLFWTKKGRGYVSKKALFSTGNKTRMKKQPTLMSIASIQVGEDDKAKVFVYAGSTRGEIFCWSPGKPSVNADGECTGPQNIDVKPLAAPYKCKGNFGAVNVLKRIKNAANDFQLLAAGKGGIILILDTQEGDLEAKVTLNLTECLAEEKFFAKHYKNSVFRSLNPQIRSVDMDIYNGDEGITRTVIIGTKGCEIYEFSLENKENKLVVKEESIKCIMQGHSTGDSKNGAELWGLAIHPATEESSSTNESKGKMRKPLYATSGDDNRVRVWNVGKVGNANLQSNRPRLIAISEQLDAFSRALDWSRDGEKMAVGLGGRVGTSVVGTRSKHDGEVLIFNFELDSSGYGKLSEFKKLKPHPKDWISDIKYSGNGTLAIGSHDRSIYLYNSKTYEYRAKCKGISSYVSHIDFSVDGQHLQSTDGSYELLFWDTKSGKQIKSAPSVANVCWDTFTCTLGWPVQGIWPPGSDGTDINAVDLLPDSVAKGNRRERKNIYSGVLATADDFGKVKLFNSPCTGEKASGIEYRGHSSHVTNVRFAANIKDYGKDTNNNTRLISTGGNDRSIFQWRYNPHDDANEDDHGHQHDPDHDSEHEDFDADQKTDEKHDESMDGFDFGSGGGDEFMAVKPWLGAIKAPSKVPHCDKTEPESDLDLKVVHGYRSFDTRDNVRYAGKDNEYIVYHAAALGIRVKKRDKSDEKMVQTYNQDHTDDITCLAVSNCKEYVATGEVGKKPKIVVWKVSNGEECRTHRVLSGFHKREVSLLAFSSGPVLDESCYLASIGQDENHSICIYNYKTGIMVANAKGDKNKVFALEFVSRKVRQNLTLVQCGINHVRIWTMNGRNLASKKVPFDKGIDTCLSLTYVTDYMLIGGAKGKVYYLKLTDKVENPTVKCLSLNDKECNQADKESATHGPINSIYALDQPGKNNEILVATGCVKGIIRVGKFVTGAEAFPQLETHNIINGVQWKKFEGPFNKWNVMKTVYKVSTKKKGKKKMSKATIDVDVANPQIRSVCLAKHEHGFKLLVGTRGSEIVEFKLKDADDISVKRREVDFNENLDIITRGHFKDEVWGLVVDKAPNGKTYITSGDDGYVRLWDLEKEKQIENFRLGSLGLSDPVMARSCAMSPASSTNPRLLAVGLGGNVGRGKTKHDGKIVVFVYRADALADTGEQKLVPVIGDVAKQNPPLYHAKGWISDIKFSANQVDENYKGYLAVGSHDRNIYIYEAFLNVAEAKETKSLRKGCRVGLKHKLKGHNSYLTHLDFSVDGKWLQSNCGAYELLFWDVKRGRRQTSAGAMRDVIWDTFTCILGWPVQGIWPKCADGTDINAVDRESNQKVIITADDFGKLKMFRYPCVEQGSSFGQETGHSSHVTNVRWMKGDEYVISTGGNDRCVFQWENINSSQKTPLASNARDGTYKDRDEESVEDEDDFSDPFASVGNEEGDQSMAVKPWKGQIVPPSDRDASRAGNPTKPRFNLELEYVCGYQAQDPNSRGNLRFSSSGDIIYHTAAIGVVEHLDGTSHHHENSRQRYFKGHDDDIVCLTTDATAKFVATGQMQSEHERKVLPAVKVWDADSCREICTLGGFHKRAVSSVAFHPNGMRLLSVGNDDDHSVALWETNTGTWEDGKLLTTARGDKSTVLWAAFTPTEVGTLFVTGGVRHIRFWTLSGRSLKSKLGNRQNKKLNTQICGTYVGHAEEGHRFLTGSAGGWVNVWNTNTPGKKSLGTYESSILENMAKQDGGAITAISPCYEEDVSDGVDTIVCGTKNGNIYVVTISGKGDHKWSFSSTDISIKNQKFPSFDPEIRSVCIDKPLNKILVGTKSSEIYLADYEEGAKNVEWELLVAGHYADELWGLAVNPDDPNVFATAGDDKTVRVWERNNDTGHVILKHICKCRDMSRAIAWFDGNTIIAGLGGRVGRKVITGKRKRRRKKGRKRDEAAEDHTGEIDVFCLKMKQSQKPAGKVIEAEKSGMQFDPKHLPKDWISDIKVNKLGNEYVAVAAHDQKVWLYELNSSKTLFKFIGYCNKSSSAVSHVDFGTLKDKTTKENTIFLRTNDLSEEILRYTTNGKKKSAFGHVTHLREVRDVEWQSDTCILEWGTTGIWPQGAASDDINSVCTSNTGNIIVSADDHGHINLFNYPCTTQGASPVVGKGHSSHVMNVRFSHAKGQKAKTEELKIYSVGGNDRAVFQWKLSKV